jgi:hypothetical protein
MEKDGTAFKLMALAVSPLLHGGLNRRDIFVPLLRIIFSATTEKNDPSRVKLKLKI